MEKLSKRQQREVEEYERKRREAIESLDALCLPEPVALDKVIGFLPENPEWGRYSQRG